MHVCVRAIMCDMRALRACLDAGECRQPSFCGQYDQMIDLNTAETSIAQSDKSLTVFCQKTSKNCKRLFLMSLVTQIRRFR